MAMDLFDELPKGKPMSAKQIWKYLNDNGYEINYNNVSRAIKKAKCNLSLYGLKVKIDYDNFFRPVEVYTIK